MRQTGVTLLALWLSSVAGFVAAQDEGEAEVLNLESTVQGNREQPKVLYIVPWQQPGDAPELDRPISGDINLLFEPIDRRSFQRELRYIKFLRSEGEKTDNPPLFE